jgi:hypothetical protein
VSGVQGGCRGTGGPTWLTSAWGEGPKGLGVWEGGQALRGGGVHVSE